MKKLTNKYYIKYSVARCCWMVLKSINSTVADVVSLHESEEKADSAARGLNEKGE